MPRAGTGSSGGGELDHVGAHAHQFADQGSNVIGSVGNAVRVHWVAVESVPVAGCGNPVADTAGWGDDGHGGQQSGAVDQPLIYGKFEPGVQTTGVADAGVAGCQRFFYRPGGLQVVQGGRVFNLPPADQAVVLVGQVVVGVDQARKESKAAKIDLFRACGKLDGCSWANLFDPFAIYQYGRVLQNRPAGTVNQVGSE